MAVPTVSDINNLLNQYKIRLNKNIFYMKGHENYDDLQRKTRCTQKNQASHSG